MLKKINLKNKIALVTGAGKGLGKACAIALAEAGAKVIILVLYVTLKFVNLVLVFKKETIMTIKHIFANMPGNGGGNDDDKEPPK